MGSLLDSLARCIAAETRKPDFPIDREWLSRIVTGEHLMYYGGRVFADQEIRRNELLEAAPLAGTVELLKYEKVFALAALARSPDPGGMKRAEEEYEITLRAIERLAEILLPPAKRKAGKPSRTKDLRALVGRLANYWKRATGERITQDWHKEPTGQWRPVSNGAQFVYCLVEFIDPLRLGELRKVLEDTVRERRAATSCNSHT
jgi:hypothetical protein